MILLLIYSSLAQTLLQAKWQLKSQFTVMLLLDNGQWHSEKALQFNINLLGFLYLNPTQTRCGGEGGHEMVTGYWSCYGFLK